MNFCEAIGCQIRNDFFLSMPNCICRSKGRRPSVDWSSKDWYCRYLDQDGGATERDASNIFLPEAERSKIQIIAALVKSRR